MSKDIGSIVEQLTPIFRDVFDDDELVVEATMTADDVDEWDSLAHIRLIVAIEQAFKLRFSAGDIANFDNVGSMAELILKKQASA